MDTQVNILEAVRENLDSSLANIEGVIRADIFDSEIESARHLHHRGHLRAAGAVAGVVLEKHLAVVSSRYGYASRKRNPTIADFNEHLKQVGAIDLVLWRRIQGLADIRNLCDHAKEREPKDDEVDDLISGVDRLLKSLN
jgi:uncharacterized protein (UPF0332 family)